MNHSLVALILAIGAAALNYSYIGKHIGYSNSKRVWITTLAVFVVAYLIVWSTFAWNVHL